MLKHNLYNKKVLLTKYRILNNLESDILITERFVKSLCFAKLASIVVIISTIQAMLGIKLVVIRVV